MTLVEVPALCEFTHEGRSYVRGEMVCIEPTQALALARVHKVSLLRHDELTRDVKRYRRRDMRAEE